MIGGVCLCFVRLRDSSIRSLAKGLYLDSPLSTHHSPLSVLLSPPPLRPTLSKLIDRSTHNLFVSIYPIHHLPSRSQQDYLTRNSLFGVPVSDFAKSILTSTRRKPFTSPHSITVMAAQPYFQRLAAGSRHFKKQYSSFNLPIIDEGRGIPLVYRRIMTEREPAFWTSFEPR